MSAGNVSSCSNQPCPSSTQLKLYQTVIFATPVLFTLLLLMLFFILYLRRRRIARLNSRIRGQIFTRDIISTPLEQGLSKSFRQRLPIIPFDERLAASKEDTQCSVCLGDYQLNEKLRQLPVCGHTFHVECIDEWLASNATCPICRTSLIHEERVVSLGSPLHGTGSGQPSSCMNGRMWEDRVVGETQDRNANMRMEDVGESSSALVSGAEVNTRLNNEHVISLERS